jgi:DNA replication protein DnaD
LLNWEKKGVQTLGEVALLDEEFMEGKEKKKKQSRKTGKTRWEELDEILSRIS